MLMENNHSEPEIDFNHLNQYVGGDVSLTKEVFSLFKNQVDMWSKALVADADDEVWAGLTHSLMGTAKAVGAIKLAKVCEDSEKLVGENARLAARQVAVDKLEHRISQAMAEIQRWEYKQKLNEMRSSP